MPPKASQKDKEVNGGTAQPSLFAFFKKSEPTQPAASRVVASASTPTTRPSSASNSLATPPITAKKKLTPSSSSSQFVDGPAVSSSSSVSKPKPKSSPTLHASSHASSSSIMTPTVGRVSGSSSSLTPPITSDDDGMEVDALGSNGMGGSSSVVKARKDAFASSSSQPQVPVKRAASGNSDDEDEESVVPRKRANARAATRPTVIESSDEDDVLVSSPKKRAAAPTSKSKAKSKKKNDDDDFSGASGGESDDYFNDDLDSFLVDDDDAGDSDHLPSSDEDVKPKAAKAKAVAKPKANPPKVSTAPPPRPGPKPLAGGRSGSGTSSIRTQAEMQKLKEKEKKMANEEVFEFLIDPKDADGIRPGEEGYDPRTLHIPAKAWKSFTPFEVQFWEVKCKHYDTVLFFQKGKFFELYEEDASIGHREFDLKLTDRVKMRMVGVPESSFDFWAAKFLAQGYKVGRVDQCETALGAEMRVKDGKANGKKPPANGKAIVRRELKTVYTSGTIVDGSMLTDDLSNHCVAIKEYTPNSASPPSFGICVLDASTAEFSLSFFEDDTSRTQVETLIRQLKPKELIHEKSNLSVSTLRLLRNCLSLDCQWTALKSGTEFLRPDDTRHELRKLFKPKVRDEDGELVEMEEDGEEDDEDARIPENIRKMFDKPMAMSALGGMIWYLRQLNLDSDLVTAKNFNIYDPLSQGKAMVLDGQTLAHMEVLQNSQGGVEGTLFQLLSRCITPFGKRLFKIWLCAPLREASAINDRLDAVGDLLDNSAFVVRFDQMAKKLPDLERMLSRIHARSCKKQEFLKVVEAFGKIAKGLVDLVGLCDDFKSEGVKNTLRSAPDLLPLLDSIKSIYDGEELLPVEGMDEDYERVRQNVQTIEDQLQEQLERAKVMLKIKKAEFRDIGTKDIYQMQIPSKTKVPANWTLMSNTKDFDRYWSPEVTKLVQQLKEARERELTVINDFQYKVFGEFDKDYSVWMQAVKLVAELDCLMSLSKSSAALGEPAVRPEIIEADTAFVDFEELRHPCVLSASTDFIPNDVALGADAQNMVLLTGPNMAGKSTMLRMTCIAIIMAQLGCYVPASKARIAPVDAIYSRMGANDFIFANASTFKVELDDTNKILRKSTPKSVVILDELGRGTSSLDGSAIAFACLHYLATHVGCIGFFATHFTSLTEDFAYHPQIAIKSMACQVDADTHSVVFLYKLRDGAAPKSYGPHVASMAGMPDLLVKRAIGISGEFEETLRKRVNILRAGQTVDLTAQADAAFLLKFARMELDFKTLNPAQLKRTLAIIRRAAVNAQALKADKVVEVAA